MEGGTRVKARTGQKVARYLFQNLVRSDGRPIELMLIVSARKQKDA